MLTASKELLSLTQKNAHSTGILPMQVQQEWGINMGNVTHLDTVHFNDTMTAYTNYIKQFEGIVRGVNATAGRMVENWKGKGRNAFEKDYKQVQLNLNDISDIMYDLRDALIDAHAEYMKTDSALSKSFES